MQKTLSELYPYLDALQLQLTQNASNSAVIDLS